jgi:phosphoglycolate phosphatase-like HAD superfamily hydrolase
VDRLILWDVDGTLIHSSGIGAAVFDRALERVVGTAPMSTLVLGGKTDPQIALEYMEAMAVDDADGKLALVLEAVEAEVAAAATLLAETGNAMPGVPELLARLHAEEGVHQSLLTGNTAANAAVKVTAFGLQQWLDLEVGAYGSDHADRRELVPIAVERARRLRGWDVDAAAAWVVGDTANDLACARAGGARCLLVATGKVSLKELEGLGADCVLQDLSNTDAVVRILTDRDR